MQASKAEVSSFRYGAAIKRYPIINRHTTRYNTSHFERHIEADGDPHRHPALQMGAGLCSDDDVKRNEAAKAAQQALAMRVLLWDSVGN